MTILTNRAINHLWEVLDLDSSIFDKEDTITITHPDGSVEVVRYE